MSEIIVVCTGHRPPRLGLDYSAESNRILTDFAEHELGSVLLAHYVTEVVSGMAQGWDQAVAHAAFRLGIPLVAAVPFDSQEAKWPEEAKRRYYALLAKASLVHVVSPGGYAAKKFIVRDHWMVDRAVSTGGLLMSLWDGKSEGGTWHTVNYAQQQGVSVVNCWSNWGDRLAMIR